MDYFTVLKIFLVLSCHISSCDYIFLNDWNLTGEKENTGCIVYYLLSLFSLFCFSFPSLALRSLVFTSEKSQMFPIFLTFHQPLLTPDMVSSCFHNQLLCLG